MIIELTCPHCHAVVAAREADRGETIRCGICWKEVPVPAACSVPVPPAAPAPLIAAVLPTAKLIPTKPAAVPVPLPAARPVTATPIKVTPVPIPIFPAKDVASLPPKMRSAHRDEEGDEAFSGRSSRSSNAGVLVLISVLGLLIVGGLSGGIYILVRGSGGDKADGTSSNGDGYVDPKPLWDPKADPGKFAPPPANDAIPPFNPFPNNPAPYIPPVPKPPKEPEWVPVANADGFEANVPAAMTLRDGFPLMHTGRMRIQGKVYSMSPPVNIFGVAHISVQIDFVDLPAEYPFEAEKVLRELTHLRTGPAVPAILSGLSGKEITETLGVGSVKTARGVKIGPRFFVVKCDTWNPNGSFPKSEEYAKKVFDSFKITYDAKTAAPAAKGSSGPPVAGDPRPGESSPFLPPAAPVAAAAVTAPYVVARPQPFWGAVFLADRNELFTVGPRLVGNFGRGGGVLRRYALPGFQLKASYPMPRAATRAVYDVATSMLYCTTLAGNRPDPTVRDGERVVAFGDVEAYDLAPIFKGTATEKDELKPTFAVSGSGAKFTGLDLSPDGKWLYTVRTVQLGSATKPRGWKAALVRVDISQRKIVDPIDLPMPVLQMKLAPDGGSIFLAEIQLTDAGAEIAGAGRAGKLDVVDVVGWRLKHNVLVAGSVLDLAVTNDGSRLVCGIQGTNGQSLSTVAAAGNDAILCDPPADTARAAGYVAVSADGRHVVATARQTEGVDVYEIQDLSRKDGLKLIARGKEAAGVTARTPLGGHFYLSPDGRFAVFQVGAVVNIQNPTKKPD